MEKFLKRSKNLHIENISNEASKDLTIHERNIFQKYSVSVQQNEWNSDLKLAN